MNVIPATILDNFLENPNTIRDWGLSLEFSSDPSGRWPGKRTACLSTIHPPLFDYINKKVLSLFFEDKTSYSSILNFQLIEGYEDRGWIHQDGTLLTYIIYLSKEDETNCGTSIYNKTTTKPHIYNSTQEQEIQLYKFNFYNTKTISPEAQNQKDEFEKSTFNKILDIKDIYNRLLCFSSDQYHSANNFSNKNSSRLTLIGFIHKINNSNLPILRSKQTLMM